MQNVGGTNKEYYGIFLNWPVRVFARMDTPKYGKTLRDT